LKNQDAAVLVALGIGLAIVMPFHVITAHFAKRPVFDELLVPVFISAALAALPFLTLAGKMLYDKVTWVIGVALIVPAWVFLLYTAVSYQLSGDSSGVGGEALIILVWPILVTIICVRLGRWRSQ
jgi:hypothetical protein